MNLFNVEICRTCMAEAENNRMLHFIYDTPSENSTQSTADLLLSTIPRLHIELRDELPKNICMQCLDTLHKMANFQEMCLQSQSKLLEKLMATRAEMQTSTKKAEDKVTLADVDSLQNSYWILKKEVNEAVYGESAGTDEMKASIEEKEQTHAVVKDESMNSQSSVREGSQEYIGDYKFLHTATAVNPLDSMENVKSEDMLEITEEFIAVDADPQSTSLQSAKIQIIDEEYGTSSDNTPTKSKEQTLSGHTDERQHHCIECGKVFAQLGSLRTHLLCHSGEKNYKCLEFCSKDCKCHCNLSPHRKVPSKLKPYICDVCDAAFSRAVHLKEHLLFHMGKKPYKCKYCDNSINNAQRHQRTKLFKCKYCKKTFSQCCNLVEHIRTHLGENVNRSELCPQKFPTASEAREHFALHKNDDRATHLKNVELKAALTVDNIQGMGYDNKENPQENIREDTQSVVPIETTSLSSTQNGNVPHMFDSEEELGVFDADVPQNTRKNVGGREGLIRRLIKPQDNQS